jgi:hypothetical protein
MKKYLSYCCLVWLTVSARLCVAEQFRTDINPALLYWQAVAEWPNLSEEDHQYVFNTQWRGRKLEERFVHLPIARDFRVVWQGDAPHLWPSSRMPLLRSSPRGDAFNPRAIRGRGQWLADG